MPTVWKDQLPLFCDDRGPMEISVPKGAVLLSVQEQNGLPTVWFYVPDTAAGKTMARIWGIGTGHKVNFVPEGSFLNTVLCNNGENVYHYWGSVNNG